MRTERMARAAVAVAGSALLAVSGTVPALAHRLRFARAGNSANLLFGGWRFTPKVAPSVTTQFKVPTFKCTSTMTGVGPLAIMFTGTSTAQKFNAAGLLMECSSGKPDVALGVVVDGTAWLGTNTVAAGDMIKSTVTTTKTTTTATAADLTKGQTLTRSAKGAAALYVWIGDDALVSAARLPIPNFGTITYGSAAIGTTAIGQVTPHTGVNMETTKKVLQILTGPIRGTKMNAFTTTFKHP